ncbi:hypothetical protein GGR57DRAFT_463894 [Xylariaceae sp. FL1272]|nr:hypothetical protein GGR57DRAFT_463894 [Xylariaceae sp. FL1272]
MVGLKILSVTALLAAPLIANPIKGSEDLLPTKVVAQLSEDATPFESIAVRANGDLLVAQHFPNATLYIVEQPTSENPKLSPLHTFNEDNGNGLSGIVETSYDKFVVVVAQFEAITKPPVTGTNALWEISFDSTETSNFTTRRIADIPEAIQLNGLVKVPNCKKNIILATDSGTGVLYRIDVQTGDYSIVLDVPELKITPNSTKTFAFAANGIKIRNGYVNWANSEMDNLFKTAIDGDGYPKSGAPIEKVADVTASWFIDDFAFDERGNIWATTNVANTIVTIKPDGSQRIKVGAEDQLTVGGVSCAAFGRTKADRDVLYGVTFGAVGNPINGTISEPGKIVAVNTRTYY